MFIREFLLNEHIFKRNSQKRIFDDNVQFIYNIYYADKSFFFLINLNRTRERLLRKTNSNKTLFLYIKIWSYHFISMLISINRF